MRNFTAANGTDRPGFSKPRSATGTPSQSDGKNLRRSARGSQKYPSMTPDEARKKMNQALAIPNINERANECGKIISALCEAGYTEEAWQMIGSDPGIVRSREIQAFFRSADLTSEELPARMEQLLYAGEAFEALGGYLSSRSIGELKSLGGNQIKVMEKLPGMRGEEVQNAFTGVLLNKLAGQDKKHNDPVQVVQTAVDFHRNGSIDDYGLAMVLKIDPTRDTFQKYQTLSIAISDTPPGGIQAAEIRKDLIRNMIYENAPLAMESILSFRGEKALNDLSTAVERYLSMDPTRAEKWLTEHRSNLSETQNDAAAMVFFKSVLNRGEAAAAGIWASQLRNPDMKNKAKEALAKRFPRETAAPEPNQ